MPHTGQCRIGRTGLRPRPRGPRAQPEGRRRRHPARRAGGVHRRVRVGQVVAGLRHALRRGPAALPRVGVALRAPAVPPARRAGRRRDRRAAAGRRAAAAARRADDALVGRQRHHAVEPAADALLARRRRIRRAQPHAVRRGRSRRTRRRAPARPATASAASTTPPRRRWCPTIAHDPRAGDRRVAAGLARAEPPRHRSSRSAIDVDTPWRDLPRKDRDWLLFTDEQPTVPVYAGFTPAEMRRALKRKDEPSYMGTFIGRPAVRAADVRDDRERRR